MKTRFILLILLYLPSVAFAQNDKYRQQEMMTITGQGKSTGIYGCFSGACSIIDNQPAVDFSMKGMFVLNHSFAIGFEGTGFITQPVYDATSETDSFLTGGYCGFALEGIVAPMLPVHLSFPVLIGAGGLSRIETDWEYTDYPVNETEFFLIIEPGVDIEFNVTRFFRMGMGISYRLPSHYFGTGAGIPDISPSSLRGITYGISFKIGKF